MGVTELALDGVVKAYPGFRLGPISLSVGEEVLAVLGPSGCGKTTLLSIIAGVVAPDAGRVNFDGVDVTGRPPERRRAALVFQDGALFPHLTARANIAYAATAADRVDSLATTLGIDDLLDRHPTALSGGQRQRVALARALAADPDALLLDEPLANLDAPIKRRLRDELRDLLASLRVPVVYVTHDQREATAVGDRIAVVDDGRLHQVGPPHDVFERPATPFVASFTGGANVYRAAVIRTGLSWGEYELTTVTDGFDAGDRVWFCVRPEHVVPAVDGAPTAPDATVVAGRIARRRFEGDAHRVTVTPDGVDAALEMTVLPPTYDRLELDARDRVRVSLPATSIHLIDAA